MVAVLSRGELFLNLLELGRGFGELPLKLLPWRLTFAMCLPSTCEVQPGAEHNCRRNAMTMRRDPSENPARSPPLE